MSALTKFNNHCFSEWYLAAIERVLFPCENEEEINAWKENVCHRFRLDSSVVRDHVTFVI
ncbi:hypothetical protein JVT61DRAFT_12049 [Boletus reticuloceps]|uniref:Uncharacterized protein n=1 Tax=Boletus reticuloceps TaxID=495285 RepID=A0A8I2YEE8_9AGAM|nr:hypothetical protein JVT61DRAFT_12049 [Boletus reticuloceps]